MTVAWRWCECLKSRTVRKAHIVSRDISPILLEFFSFFKCGTRRSNDISRFFFSIAAWHLVRSNRRVSRFYKNAKSIPIVDTNCKILALPWPFATDITNACFRIPGILKPRDESVERIWSVKGDLVCRREIFKSGYLKRMFAEFYQRLFYQRRRMSRKRRTSVIAQILAKLCTDAASPLAWKLRNILYLWARMKIVKFNKNPECYIGAGQYNCLT